MTSKEYYQSHKEYFRTYQKAYVQKNREAVYAIHKRYRLKHDAELRARRAAYFVENQQKYGELGRTVKAAREAAGYTKSALAAVLGVTPTTICYWEAGKVPPPMGRLREVLPIPLTFGV